MPKISDEARERRRAQILDAAWRCFEKEGLHATTMQDIIGASGLSAGAVYSYFRSKDELILAAVTTSLGRLGQTLAETLRQHAPGSAQELLGQLIPAIAGFSAREGYDLRRIALLGWSEAQRNESLKSAMRQYYRAFRAELGKAALPWLPGASADEADAVARLLLSVLLGTVVQSAILEDATAADIVRGLDLVG